MCKHCYSVHKMLLLLIIISLSVFRPMVLKSDRGASIICYITQTYNYKYVQIGGEHGSRERKTLTFIKMAKRPLEEHST